MWQSPEPKKTYDVIIVGGGGGVVVVSLVMVSIVFSVMSLGVVAPENQWVYSPVDL